MRSISYTTPYDITISSPKIRSFGDDGRHTLSSSLFQSPHSTCFSSPSPISPDRNHSNSPWMKRKLITPEVVKQLKNVSFFDEDPVQCDQLFPDRERVKDIGLITVQDLLSIQETNYDVELIDCRFDYEYRGGHAILNGKEAILVNSEQDLLIKFHALEPSPNKVLVFYCEYSELRGPRLASMLRQYDKDNLTSESMELRFPEVYILRGGYKELYEQYPRLCVGDYVPMRDTGHIGERRTAFTRHPRLSRSHTYANLSMSTHLEMLKSSDY